MFLTLRWYKGLNTLVSVYLRMKFVAYPLSQKNVVQPVCLISLRFWSVRQCGKPTFRGMVVYKVQNTICGDCFPVNAFRTFSSWRWSSTSRKSSSCPFSSFIVNWMSGLKLLRADGNDINLSRSIIIIVSSTYHARNRGRWPLVVITSYPCTTGGLIIVPLVCS